MDFYVVLGLNLRLKYLGPLYYEIECVLFTILIVVGWLLLWLRGLVLQVKWGNVVLSVIVYV